MRIAQRNQRLAIGLPSFGENGSVFHHPLLAGLSEEAAHIVDPSYQVNPACNYYFMAASTLLIAAAGTWVTERIVVPRLGEYEGDARPEKLTTLTSKETRGLIYATVVIVVLLVLVVIGLVPEHGFLRDAETGSVLRSPFMRGIVAFIFMSATLAGIAFGLGAGTIRSDSDIMNGMGKSMETLGLYMVGDHAALYCRFSGGVDHTAGRVVTSRHSYRARSTLVSGLRTGTETEPGALATGEEFGSPTPSRSGLRFKQCARGKAQANRGNAEGGTWNLERRERQRVPEPRTQNPEPIQSPPSRRPA